MKKYIFLISIILVIGLVFAAKPDFTQKVNLPAHAKEVAPGVFYLGKAMDKGKVVEGYAFIKHKKNNEKPGTTCGNGICEPGENVNKCPADCGGSSGETDTSSCYEFLAREAKWKTAEPYMVNPTNFRGLSDLFVRDTVSYSINKWEDAADGLIDGNIVEIIGSEIADEVDGPDMEAPDGKNELQFGIIDYPGAIAMTIAWGIWNGPPSAREIVEWDHIYDQVDYAWGDCEAGGCEQDPGPGWIYMDFENIATHEFGHSVGLGDLYDDKCSEVTMYGYAGFKETIKRTLEEGDINGVKKLYS